MPGQENQIAVNVDKLLKAFKVPDDDFESMKKDLKGALSSAGQVGTRFSNAEKMVTKLDDADFVSNWKRGQSIIDAIKAASEKAGGGSIAMAEAKKKKKNLRIKISGYS